MWTPKIIADWRAVLRHAWSVRLMIVAAILSGVEIVLPLLADTLPIPAGVFAGLSFAATAGAFAARFVAQRQLQGKDQ